MENLIIIIAVLTGIHLVSFAKFNLSNDNKRAATGSIILALAVLIMSFFV